MATLHWNSRHGYDTDCLVQNGNDPYPVIHYYDSTARYNGLSSCIHMPLYKPSGISIPKSSMASLKTCLTNCKSLPPVICLVPATISRPSDDTIRRYPHQLLFSPADHLRMGALYRPFERSQVLKAAGTKYSSAML